MDIRRSEATGRPVYIVVDDFFDDPWAVRKFALECSYRDSTDGWPGRKSDVMWQGAREALVRMAGYVPGPQPSWVQIEESYRFWGEAFCGGFQTLTAGLGNPGEVHGHRKGQWAGNVFLSLPEQCDGRASTYLFRHKATGSTTLESMDSDQYKALREDSFSPEKWEVLAAAEMRFNRLVLIDSRCWHSWSEGFGDSVENCRLTNIYNFRTDLPRM